MTGFKWPDPWLIISPFPYSGWEPAATLTAQTGGGKRKKPHVPRLIGSKMWISLIRKLFQTINFGKPAGCTGWFWLNLSVNLKRLLSKSNLYDQK